MTIGILIALIILVLALVNMYNGLIKKKNDVEQAFSDIDVYLKKRHDLIPNLVETVKAYMTHEKDLLTKVTELRAKAMNPSLSMNEKVEAENQLGQTLGNIMVAVENYPELKANENFLKLQSSIENIELEISKARLVYNAKVTTFNNAVEMFPTNIMARFMSYSPKEYFIIPEAERKNIDVKNLFNNN